MFLAYSIIFITIFCHIRLYFCRFRHVQNTGTVRDIFMDIMAYLETMTYLGIFKIVDIFSKFQARYSGVSQEQFI